MNGLLITRTRVGNFFCNMWGVIFLQALMFAERQSLMLLVVRDLVRIYFLKKRKKVVGIDNSLDAIHYCKEHYKKPNLSFLQMNCNRLALPSSIYDVVVSFETLEHVQDADVLLQELSRVLKQGGMLIMSTPNRENFSLYTKGVKNPFHIKEYDENEFAKLIGTHFEMKEILGQKFFCKKRHSST